MSEVIPPSRQALNEALSLSTEILRNIEMSEIPLTNIALKASRLARLLNDFDMQKILEYEVSGYPSTPDGVPTAVWRLAEIADRKFVHTEPITKKSKTVIFLESISSLEEQIRTTEAALDAARDPETPAPPRKGVLGVELPSGNSIEQAVRLGAAQQAAQRLASRRNLIYQYVLRKHYELKFSGIADDVFSRVRERVDATVGAVIPEAVKRLSAVYENLLSDNPEDWSNAVHSCRRILQDLADAIFPPTDEVREVRIEGKVQRIKLGREHYVNRIITFIQANSDSGRFQDVVGSQLSYLGNRLDSIVEAANKGTHDTIVSREEADRYVVYTYLIVGDILTLVET
jgi:hypothetical protein